ncbi:hypothetical protein J6590_024398 [Homalodisca vitripennis]|nr:hypothetical protein J6590_024398 [Homalodisca vitripennis]
MSARQIRVPLRGATQDISLAQRQTGTADRLLFYSSACLTKEVLLFLRSLKLLRNDSPVRPLSRLPNTGRKTPVGTAAAIFDMTKSQAFKIPRRPNQSSTQCKNYHHMHTRIGLRNEGLYSDGVPKDRFDSVVYLHFGREFVQILHFQCRPWFEVVDCRVSTQDGMEVGNESGLTPGGFPKHDEKTTALSFGDFPPAHRRRIYLPTAD